ncbi:major head protein [Streptomyces phage WRightOn]|uniref:Major capsid protein n=1 Tax=Streptomyces phage WRightOn TaxID=2053723 RepID=A0A2H4PI28_9CAUD|nr:major head protein [Streptomyces phage WRightOn]ATW62473.1 major capsid protein [Streptomyces phage WRightOn]
MANAFTGTAAMANLVQTTYDRALEFALRAQPMFRMVADKRPVQQAMPGSSVVFEIYQDLAQAVTPLNELVDPDAVAAGNPTTVSVTLNEYGNSILVSNKLDLFSFTDVTAGLVNQVAWNLVDSIDLVVQNVLAAGTQVIRQNGDPASVAPIYNGGTTAAVQPGSIYSSQAARLAVAKLRAQKVHPNKGSFYTTYIHPEVSHDLRAETGNAAWRDPHNYSAAGNIWAGEIGEYEGSVFIETPRCQNALNAGTTPTRVFQTYTTGQQALAEAVAEEFHTVRGPVVDKLTRFQPLGWYGVAGWALYRPEALIRTETTSSIHEA